jgi:hypothetical protein
MGLMNKIKKLLLLNDFARAVFFLSMMSNRDFKGAQA